MLLLLLFAGCTGDKQAPTDTSEVLDTGEAAVDSGDTTSEPACVYETDGYGESGTVDVSVEVVAEGLVTPWGLGWLPGGDMLLTERDGRLSRIGTDGTVTALANVPITASGEGGLLGLALHPDFATSRWLYLYYTTDNPDGAGVINRVERWTLSEDGVAAADRVIVDAIPARLYHNGGRLRFGPDGHLYVGTGDAGNPDAAQDTDSLAGKILRVDDSGGVPADNPFGNPVWIWGVRNTQGFDWIDGGPAMAVSDHGPSGLSNEDGRSGHDEVSVAEPGDNLGWPDIYACETGDGFVTPAITWADAMPPGGAAFYTGDEIEAWQGDLLVGVMGFSAGTPHLHRLRLDANGAVEITETYLEQDYGRLREVVMGPDGGLYVTTSNCDGRGTCGDGDRILRLGR